jgi:hypothetical protein
MAKSNNIHLAEQLAEAGPGVSSIEISAKALGAAQKAKRKRIFYSSCLAGCVILGAAFFLLSPSYSPSGEKISANFAAESTEQAYFNEWPEPASTKHSPKKISSVYPPHLHQQAESTKVLPVVSERSLLSLSKQKKELSPVAMAYIQSELMELHSVTFNKPEQKKIILAMNADVPETAGAAHTMPGKKNFDWYVGLGFNPQASNYQISKNANRHNMYDGQYWNNYSDLYVNNLKNQSKVYSYNTSVKAGFVYKNKWMVQAAAGYQSFKYVGKGNNSAFAGSVNEPVSFANNAPLASNSYKYMNFSVEASRLFEFKNVGLKTGISFSASRLLSANTVIAEGQNMFSFKKQHRGAPLSKWMYAPGIHVGLVKNFSDRVQMQASPNVYYNINSIFNRNYVVTQKPYGVGLDLSLMIRIN